MAQGLQLTLMLHVGHQILSLQSINKVSSRSLFLQSVNHI